MQYFGKIFLILINFSIFFNSVALHVFCIINYFIFFFLLSVLQRSLQVANNGNAIILCKATDLSNTWFYDETGENVTQLLNVKDEVSEGILQRAHLNIHT